MSSFSACDAVELILNSHRPGIQPWSHRKERQWFREERHCFRTRKPAFPCGITCVFRPEWNRPPPPGPTHRSDDPPGVELCARFFASQRQRAGPPECVCLGPGGFQLCCRNSHRSHAEPARLFVAGIAGPGVKTKVGEDALTHLGGVVRLPQLSPFLVACNTPFSSWT